MSEKSKSMITPEDWAIFESLSKIDSDSLRERDIVSHAEIYMAEYPDIKFFIKGLIPEGLTLISGPPKHGKSWLAMDMVLSVATGDDAFCCIPTVKTGALYLALEDNQSRVKSRTMKMKVESGIHDLLFSFGWPRIDRGGLVKLDKFFIDNPDVRFVVIDTFKRIKAQGNESGGLYAMDYDSVSGLQALALKHHAAIILIHHTNQSEKTDIFERASGSSGLQGGCDNEAIFIRKGKNATAATLYLHGRDIEENRLELTWNAERSRWSASEGQSHNQYVAALDNTVERFLAYSLSHGVRPTAQYVIKEFYVVDESVERAHISASIQRLLSSGRVVRLKWKKTHSAIPETFLCPKDLTEQYGAT